VKWHNNGADERVVCASASLKLDLLYARYNQQKLESPLSRNSATLLQKRNNVCKGNNNKKSKSMFNVYLAINQNKWTEIDPL
jgi:hypothetical protein